MSDFGLDPNIFDASHFSVDSYVRKIDKPWGHELHLVPQETSYMLKIIHINSGARLSLQVHDQKSESWTLMSGEAKVVWENSDRNLVETILEKGRGYTTKIGQRHRLVAIGDCDILEASTPESGTTWRLEDDYERPHETPEQREDERKNM